MDDPVDTIAHFTNPPVVEVVASVGFARMHDATMMSVGELWRDHLRGQFAEFSLVSPYEMPEDRRPAGPTGPDIRLQVGIPPLPRVWITSEGHTELVQVQPNYFAVNWRKVKRDDEYDHWRKRRLAFRDRWESFRAWAHEHDETIEPARFEITYVNHMTPLPEMWSEFSEANVLFEGLTIPELPDADLEQFSFKWTHNLEPTEAVSSGKVLIEAEPWFYGPEGSPGIRLSITVRGNIGRPGDVLGALDRGRDVLVHAFLGVTSSAARETWGEVR